ncbi:CoA-binding protein [Plastorhodobacter daqingensis]|uniref:CoA-binding protein n=1 Tax=Plastorhodobacter daqingensis TaxID=1387281 RepID=A0ABW2UFK6_9RHOB
MDQNDMLLRQILSDCRTIAVVGFSANPMRPSHGVARYLAQAGYRVIPVNPGHAGQEIAGMTVVGALSDIAEPVDMVDIFRRSEHVLPVVEEALTLPGLKCVWMQLGVRNAEAAALARAQDVQVVEDRCTKIEHARLLG